MSTETVDEYIIVMEYKTRDLDEGGGYGTLHAMVEELREWHPAALFSPDRYALQLHVMARRPTEALRRAQDLHDRAVDALGVVAPALARIEVLTGGEFDRQWQEPERWSTSPTLGESVLSNELYSATRSLLRATTVPELTDILVEFVTAVGGSIQSERPEATPDQAVIDVSIEEDGTLFAVVERVSVSGLIVVHCLPTLVADARAVRGRRQLAQPGADELGVPRGNGWRCSGAGG